VGWSDCRGHPTLSWIGVGHSSCCAIRGLYCVGSTPHPTLYKRTTASRGFSGTFPGIASHLIPKTKIMPYSDSSPVCPAFSGRQNCSVLIRKFRAVTCHVNDLLYNVLIYPEGNRFFDECPSFPELAFMFTSVVFGVLSHRVLVPCFLPLPRLAHPLHQLSVGLGRRSPKLALDLAYIWKTNLCCALCAGTVPVCVLSTQQPCLARARPQLFGFHFLRAGRKHYFHCPIERSWGSDVKCGKWLWVVSAGCEERLQKPLILIKTCVLVLAVFY